MSKPEDIPNDVWRAAELVITKTKTDEVVSEGGNVSAMIDAIIHDHTLIARAILTERNRCIDSIRRAGERVGGIEVPLMNGDNLAISLCTHFDDGGPNDGDTGWSLAATRGYQQTIKAIRDHFNAAISEEPQS